MSLAAELVGDERHRKADFVLEPTRNLKDTTVISEEVFLFSHYQLHDKDACFECTFRILP